MDKIAFTNDNPATSHSQPKKEWKKPEVKVLDIKNTNGAPTGNANEVDYYQVIPS